MSRLAENSSPTIADIARACGVSKATVSYVMNGKSTLKEETRERILRTMSEMNYHPSAVARGLNSKKVNTFGLLLPVFTSAEFVTNSYANGLLQGMCWQAQREGFNITIITSSWEGVEVSGRQLKDGRVDGVVVVAPPLYSDIMPGLASLNMPSVAIAAKPHDGVAVVDVDNAAGMRIATNHLLELGHRRIAYLTGNDDLASYEPRMEGFKSAMAAEEVEIDPALIQVSRFDGKAAFEQTSALLRRPEPPTAILCGNDNIALAVIDAARCAGLNVPRDLSVVGFDDVPAATFVTPNLTTIHQPLMEIGEKAISLLVEGTTKAHSLSDVHLLAPQLMVRGSTGVLRRAR